MKTTITSRKAFGSLIAVALSAAALTVSASAQSSREPLDVLGERIVERGPYAIVKEYGRLVIVDPDSRERLASVALGADGRYTVRGTIGQIDHANVVTASSIESAIDEFNLRIPGLRLELDRASGSVSMSRQIEHAAYGASEIARMVVQFGDIVRMERMKLREAQENHEQYCALTCRVKP